MFGFFGNHTYFCILFTNSVSIHDTDFKKSLQKIWFSQKIHLLLYPIQKQKQFLFYERFIRCITDPQHHY